MSKENHTLLEIISDKYPIPLMEDNELIASECVGYCKAVLSMQPSNKDIENYKQIALGFIARKMWKISHNQASNE